ncbi:MAG TPA: glycoside hydrolase family 16 protein [Labilithrix sp.]|nr:glycoside hydrolase family 16 protein [Labilithrix sp.]
MTDDRHVFGGIFATVIALAAAPCACAPEPAATNPVTPVTPSDGGAPPVDGDSSATIRLEQPLCLLSGPPKAAPGDVLVFADEFDGASLDPSRWNTLGGDDSRESTLGTFGKDHVKVENGSLFVSTTEGAVDPAFAFTSGRIDNAHLFGRTYGRMDTRARFPVAPGLWYAIWARPWAGPFPEIDIEVLAKVSPEVWFVNHWAGLPLPADERRSYVKITTVDPTAFHVYSVLWKPGLVEWQIDGVKLMESTRGVPTTPINWTINTWVGGWAGPVGPTTSLPSSFEVDYIRVYRQDGLIAEPALQMTQYSRHGGAPYLVPPYTARTDALELDVANFDEACFHVEMREGSKLLAARDKPPFRFPLDVVPNGRHHFTFVATDGVRSVSTDADTTTY